MKKTLQLALLLLFLSTIISCNQKNCLADFVERHNDTTQSPSFKFSIGQQGIVTHANA